MPGKRMYVHDYCGVGFYMVTILTAERQPLFGTCANNCVELSDAGEVLKRRWYEIPRYCPAIESSTLAIMPDHMHGIVYVRKQLPKPVGLTIRGFKSGVTSELRQYLATPTLSAWEKGYHDRIIMTAKMLRAERHYLHDNPRRYCLRKANPQMFVRVNRLNHPRLPAEMPWAGFGNQFLLDRPDMQPIQVSRSVSPAELAAQTAAATEQAWRGVLLVSPFLSPGEKAIAHAVMQQEYGSLVLLKTEGFAPLYKPAGMFFDLCAQGRLLVLSPFTYTGQKQQLRRQQCLQMNGWVEQICADHNRS